MHISNDLPHNNRQTEAGGLGLCVDGTMSCTHTQYIFASWFPSTFGTEKKQTTGGRWWWWWGKRCGRWVALFQWLYDISWKNTTDSQKHKPPREKAFLSGVKETTNVWEVLLKTLWYMLLREVDGLDYITRQTACLNCLAKFTFESLKSSPLLTRWWWRSREKKLSNRTFHKHYTPINAVPNIQSPRIQCQENKLS